ncbi:hypothetical protein BSU04_44020 [Caballeronia sordidicola]|uniref:Uncharacterized protein n=1 Tax=Caballeronia sordidicola TaxID=196367 RepID=A0A226WLN8_CABSO|nr:hypothetical protein BSU04_44020 [Caballeronia sordidicola]
MLDLDAGGSADLLRAPTDAFAQRFGESGWTATISMSGVATIILSGSPESKAA